MPHRSEAGRLAVCGWSAGGNLAAVVCQLARDAGGPEIAGQVLVTPVTDADFTRASYIDNAEGYVLTTPLMRWFWDHYADAGDRLDPRVAPLRARDLSNLPPALIEEMGRALRQFFGTPLNAGERVAGGASAPGDRANDGSSPRFAQAARYNPAQLSLPVGARIGVYAVTAPLGEGGMGQVYRASDTMLERQVALEILPAAFAADAERLARFDGSWLSMCRRCVRPGVRASWTARHRSGWCPIIGAFRGERKRQSGSTNPRRARGLGSNRRYVHQERAL